MNQGHAQYLAGLMDGEGWVECRRKIKNLLMVRSIDAGVLELKSK